MLSYGSDVANAITSNRGSVRVPVVGTPHLYAIGAYASSMENNAERSLPLHRLGFQPQVISDQHLIYEAML